MSTPYLQILENEPLRLQCDSWTTLHLNLMPGSIGPGRVRFKIGDNRCKFKNANGDYVDFIESPFTSHDYFNDIRINTRIRVVCRPPGTYNTTLFVVAVNSQGEVSDERELIVRINC